MDRLFNRIDRSSLEPGDHIYTWCAAYIYAHHGIYIGDNKVINFTRHGKSVGTGSIIKDVFLASSLPSSSSASCTSCTPLPSGCHGVVSSCLDCFLGYGLHLYRFEYGVSRAVFLAKVRGGTCTLAPSDPHEIVIHRANYLLAHGFGCYNLFTNNCENFSVYCKTGLLIVEDKKISGQSGQITAIKKGIKAAMVATVTVAGGLILYSRSRYKSDIGVRKDVIKVAVEDLERLHEARPSLFQEDVVEPSLVPPTAK